MSESMIELGYATWGRFGQFVKSVAVLKNGKVVDPSQLKISRGDKLKIKIGDGEIIAEDDSSRKNTHIRVYVPREIVLAKISESASSSGWKGFEIVYGDGEIMGEMINEVKENGNKRTTITYKCYYYVNGDLKILLKKTQEDVHVELIGKPQLFVKQIGDKTIVTGDTYQVKDQLKALGFKWDAFAKAWYILKQDVTIEKLNEFAQVIE